MAKRKRKLLLNESTPKPALSNFEILKRVALGGLFIGLVVACDRTLGFLLGVSQQTLHVYEKDSGNINQALKADADAYILGSSRAKYHYDPKILGQATGLRFFNAGADGQDIFYFYMLTDLLEQRHKPKLYVVNLSYSDFLSSYWRYKRLPVFAPYMRQSSVVADLLIRGDFRRNLLFKSCQTYAFNSRLHLFPLNILQQDTSPPDGFRPLKGAAFQMGKQYNLMQRFDNYELTEFVNFLNHCKRQHIRVVFGVSPEYRDPSDFTMGPDEYYFLRGIRQLAKVFHIPLVELTEFSDDFYKNKTVFNDPQHLNAAGAEFFSQQFAKYLAQALALRSDAALEASPYYPELEEKDYPIAMNFN